ncbi:MAG: LysE family transporter [Capnocytophaga sp.]|nr:LysE family transporter [Capnocytophaga sp.]
MIQDIISAIPFGIFLAFTIGPVFFILLETSITRGFRAALFFDFGALLGDAFFIILAYWSTSKLSDYIKNNPNLFIYGGIIIILYGLFSYFSQRKNKKNITTNRIIEIKEKNYFSLFYKGFLLNIINVGVFAYWLAVIMSFSKQGNITSTRVITFLSAILLTYLLVDIIKILIAKRLRNKLTPMNIHKIKQGINIFLVIFGLFLIFQGIFPTNFNAVIE